MEMANYFYDPILQENTMLAVIDNIYDAISILEKKVGHVFIFKEPSALLLNIAANFLVQCISTFAFYTVVALFKSV